MTGLPFECPRHRHAHTIAHDKCTLAYYPPGHWLWVVECSCGHTHTYRRDVQAQPIPRGVRVLRMPHRQVRPWPPLTATQVAAWAARLQEGADQ